MCKLKVSDNYFHTEFISVCEKFKKEFEVYVTIE